MFRQYLKKLFKSGQMVCLSIPKDLCIRYGFDKESEVIIIETTKGFRVEKC